MSESNKNLMNAEALYSYKTVTQVLAPYSGMDKIPEHILAAAAARGTAVHQAIQNDLKGMGFFGNPNIDGYLESYCKIRDKIGTIEYLEERFWDGNLEISGQIDLIAKIDGKLCLVDWKTSQKEGNTWPYQMAAYFFLAMPIKLNIIEAKIIQLNKNGDEPKIISYSESELWKHHEMFLACLDLYNKFFSKIKDVDYEKI